MTEKRRPWLPPPAAPTGGQVYTVKPEIIHAPFGHATFCSNVNKSWLKYFFYHNDAFCTLSFYLLGDACVTSGQKTTCWFNKSNFKSKFARGMNNFGLDCMLVLVYMLSSMHHGSIASTCVCMFCPAFLFTYL